VLLKFNVNAVKLTDRVDFRFEVISAVSSSSAIENVKGMLTKLIATSAQSVWRTTLSCSEVNISSRTVDACRKY
jgi:hypothetical protein